MAEVPDPANGAVELAESAARAGETAPLRQFVGRGLRAILRTSRKLWDIVTSELQKL